MDSIKKWAGRKNNQQECMRYQTSVVEIDNMKRWAAKQYKQGFKR